MPDNLKLCVDCEASVLQTHKPWKAEVYTCREGIELEGRGPENKNIPPL